MQAFKTNGQETVSCLMMKADYSWESFDNATMLTCYMRKTVAINSTGFTMAGNSNDKVEGITMLKNRNIHYLPENISEIFPNLKVYGACEVIICVTFDLTLISINALQRPTK